MKNTTLCYIKSENKYLMLLRDKKEVDYNKNKWIGLGGKFKNNESPDECMLREVQEESGLILKSWKYRGIITFISDVYETEFMHLFTSDEFTGDIITCNEGTLEWIDQSEVMDLNLWEGDKIFLKLLLSDEPFFSLKLTYTGDDLVSAKLNGSPLVI